MDYLLVMTGGGVVPISSHSSYSLFLKNSVKNSDCDIFSGKFPILLTISDACRRKSFLKVQIHLTSNVFCILNLRAILRDHWQFLDKIFFSVRVEFQFVVFQQTTQIIRIVFDELELN